MRHSMAWVMAMCSILHTLIKVVKFDCVKLRGCNCILNTSYGLITARYSHHQSHFIRNVLRNIKKLYIFVLNSNH